MRALRPSGKRPYAIVVAPVSRRYPVLSSLRPAVCIMISDPDSPRSLSSHRLRAIFGLTEAEARLAALLAAGEELRSAAAKLGITYGTARSRLAEIFQKTETRRQGELIKLVLTTLAMA
jgi:DNA-binding CsgD family transcriptional regulator